MAEEAFRVALQTATQAANAATAALAEIKRSQAAGLASKPKELELTGRPEEDRRLWSDWQFSAIQYLMTKDVLFQTEIETHIKSPNPIGMGDLDDDQKARSRQLFSFLAGTVKGRLLALVRERAVSQNSNGYEAIRRIQAEIEPTSGAAALGLLETILGLPTPPKGTLLRDAIVGMERLFADYEATSGAKLSEHIKIASLRRLLPPELRVHVNLLVKDDSDYTAIKKAVTEYEVADRRYEPLKPETVYDHGGVVPMEVDQIQSLKGKGKGAKNDKPHCKTCGKAHAGKCWYQEGGKGKGKGNKGKGRGDKSDPPKKGDHKGSKEACQICGKKNHTADKCFQRYKDGKGSRVQAANATPETGGTASAGGAGVVMALSRAEVDTSPETELRTTTTGVRSVTAQGEALALVDAGSDEHICPASFASWIPAERLTKAPRLRDAQGTEIKHESLARTVGLVLRTTAGEQVKVKVTFLIGPVRQPILSLGKLNSTFEVYMKGGDGGKLYFPLNNIEVEVAKVQNSYYVPFVLSRPEDEISQVRAIRMLHVEGNHVCFRKKMGADPDLGAAETGI